MENKPGDGKTSPFGNGKGATSMGAASGGHDFLTDNKGSGSSSGGRDFTQESRPQSDAKKEVVPNSAEIPSGGPILKADPGAVSSKVSGAAGGGTQGVSQKPFKLGK